MNRRGCRIQIQHEQSSSDFSNLATFVAAGAKRFVFGEKQLILEATNHFESLEQNSEIFVVDFFLGAEIFLH